jgi:tetratricopeptide (TPR) repeat protein
MTTQSSRARARSLFLVVGASVALVIFLGPESLSADSSSTTPAAESRISFAGTTTFSVTIGSIRDQSIWKRELMRQALLMAARAEMGCLPADNTIGDGISRTKPSLELTCVAGTPDRVRLLQGPTAKREVVWTTEFKFDSPWPIHRAWVERMELMSRTDFVRALENAKFPTRPVPQAKNPAAPLDLALSQMIDEDLSFCAQFLALRRLHAAMASEGETAARLAGVVRAYSHLGLLTEYQWHPMSYVFKARALLYAQRWVVREPKSIPAWHHRAFAFALAGMHGDALADLQTAAKLVDNSSPRMESPAWIPLIEHYCHYDFEDLNRLRADEHLKPLASLLYFLAHEQEGSKNLTVKVGMGLIEDMPECYRILDTICHHTGPGVGNVTTQLGSQHLAMTLLARLEKVEELPPHVQRTLEQARAKGAMLTEDPDQDEVKTEIEYRTRVIASLRGVVPEDIATAPLPPDLIEPSWGCLAKIIEETTFLQLFHRAYFVRTLIGLPLDDYLDAHRPIVASHRRIAFLDQFHTQSDPQKFEAAKRNFDVTHLDFAQTRIWLHWSRGMQRQVEAIAKANQEILPNEAGLAARSNHYHVNVGRGSLLAVSPHSPYAMGIALGATPQPEAEKTWEEVAKRSPYLASSFAEVWNKRGDPAKSERFLKLAAELDPSLENYRKLAAHYKGRGDDAKWLGALDDSLKTPSLGLDHARVQCEIAKYYSDKREWDKALSYADAAGETGAQWAMTSARTVNEANQNWEVAERHYVTAIGRYGENPIEWYLFCRRNGVGNLGLAREAAFPEGVESFAAIPNIPVNYAGIALYLEEKRSKSLEVYEESAAAAPASFTAMQAASIADRLGENAKRDKLLKQVVEQKVLAPHPYDHRPHREELAELARHLIADLADGARCRFDFGKLHAIRDKALERDRCAFNYFLACYLDRHGKPDLAVTYWKQCMGAPEIQLGTRTLAGAELSKRGVKPIEWKLLFFPPKN